MNAKFLLLSFVLGIPLFLGFEAHSQAAEIRLKIGDTFPSPRLPLISKKKYDESQIRGRVVLYDLGASWSKGAGKAMRFYRDLLKKYEAKGLRIVAINIDDKLEDAQSHTLPITDLVPIFYDADKKYVEKINPEGFPMVYIVDAKGKVQDVIRDYCENEFGIMEKRVLKALGES